MVIVDVIPASTRDRYEASSSWACTITYSWNVQIRDDTELFQLHVYILFQSGVGMCSFIASKHFIVRR